MHNLKKYILLFCTYKMAKISRKTWQKNINYSKTITYSL